MNPFQINYMLVCCFSNDLKKMLIKVGVVWMWSQKQPPFKKSDFLLFIIYYLFIMQPVERKVLLVV